MKDFKLNGSVYEVTLENGKVVKVGASWVQKTIKLLGTDLEDVLLMWLEDNDYLENEELEELDQKAKKNKSNKIIKAESKDKATKKTQKERVAKDNPDKEYIIAVIAEYLQDLDISNINIENKAKLITFTYKNNDYKLDLVQKRKPKAEK